MSKKFVVTLEGLEKLKQDLEVLKTTRRREVADKIAEALKFGDLSENAEYHDAKDEQAALEGKILQLESQVKNAQVVEKVAGDNTVQVGCKVSLEDLTEKVKVEYEIVGSMEANVFESKISNESPLGASMIGKTKGDTVGFKAPGGEMSYKILKVS
ncbi:transcription elongation factor GreA [bacterium]|jgi:transcription elongation factor GreA|nr:transcription elongation factor GreA [bacterium]MBT6293262.1 transcription elongation factor GreA [bacterium]